MKKLPHAKLALGESTGHYHEAIGAGVALFEVDAETLRLSAPAGADVRHQEHQTVTLPPGDYDRTIVREFDHFSEESRAVID